MALILKHFGEIVKMALILKHFGKCMTCTHDKSIASKAPAHSNQRLLFYHNNGSLRYYYHTIDIITHHYTLLHNTRALQSDKNV